jgi:hypothetical protein
MLEIQADWRAFFASLGKYGEKNRSEDSNNSDNDKQFYQSKRGAFAGDGRHFFIPFR